MRRSYLHLVAVLLLSGEVVFSSPVSLLDCTPSYPAGNLTLLGEVDGKNFYYAFPSNENCASAGVKCSTAGMRLATITSRAQEEFLITNFKRVGLQCPFWLGANEIATPEGYRYYQNGSAPIPSVLGFGVVGSLDHGLAIQVDNGEPWARVLAIVECRRFLNLLCERPI